MLSTDLQRESIVKRIESVVSLLIEESTLFKEELNYEEIVKYLIDIAKENLTYEQFNDISDNELKEICSFIMTTEILSKIGQEFTPEQIAIFDKAIKRK